MSNVQPEEVKRAILNPQVRQAMMDTIVHKKPQGWSRRSRAPYYNEFYAKQVKETIDSMLQDRQPRLYPYKEFTSMAPSTLYLRINQSMRYLVECMDDEQRTYGKFMEMVHIERRRDRGGIIIAFKEEFASPDAQDFTPRTIVSIADAPKWREKIDKYLEDGVAGDRPLIIDGLCLTPQEIKSLKEEFMGTEETTMVDIKADCIKIVKIV